MLVTLLVLAYLFIYKPFDKSLMQKLEVFNTYTELVLLYIVLCFTNANEFRDYLIYDMAFIVCLAGNITVHMSLLLKSTFVDLKKI